jgi:DNA (cytosine-5)-methyltransferase 1
MGLYQAGFDVVGVDILPLNRQPGLFGDPLDWYPFEFRQGDALEADLSGFDLIWASPPCQAFTAYKRRPDHVAPRDNLIPPVRSRLEASGAPWIIENVPGAPLERPVTLCGSMFGLDVRRHRIFETSFPVPPLECNHVAAPRFAPAGNRTNLRSTVEVGVWRIPLTVQQQAMGIDWMSLEALSQSIPPAYSRWLGERFLEWREADRKENIRIMRVHAEMERYS